MNILFYLDQFPGWGGIETVTEIIGNKLVEKGYNISILAHTSQYRSSVLMGSADYYMMPDWGLYDTPQNRSFAEKVVKDHYFDIVIYQDSYAPTEKIAVILKKYVGHLIVCEHNTPLYVQKTLEMSYKASFLQEVYRRVYSWPKQLRANRQRHFFLLKNSDVYVVLSSGNREELIEVCGCRRKSSNFIDKIQYINNPISKVKDETLAQKENIVLFVGRLNYQKRIDIMLDAWKRLLNSNPDWRFFIVGDGPLRELLIQRVEKEHIGGVVFCGFQLPSEYYQKAKIFWMTSKFEGWGMTLLEAMQRLCVPIAMDTYSSLHDIIDDGINGIICPADNLEEFVKMTRKVMDNSCLRDKMSLDAFEKVKAFEIDNIVEQWVRLFTNIKK